MARSIAASVFLAASPAGRRTLIADRFLPLLDSDPELHVAILNAMPNRDARVAFQALCEAYRTAYPTARTA
jgi:hypothetical protein